MYERHGLRKDPLYRIWSGIKQRCYNIKRKDYAHYGGKGITMSDKWRNSFHSFFRDMSKGYSKGLQIDRIDNLKGYEPNNCRWVTAKEQSNNRRVVRPVMDSMGRKFSSVAEAAAKTGIHRRNIQAVLRGKRHSAGKDAEGQKIFWEYLK